MGALYALKYFCKDEPYLKKKLYEKNQKNIKKIARVFRSPNQIFVVS